MTKHRLAWPVAVVTAALIAVGCAAPPAAQEAKPAAPAPEKAAAPAKPAAEPAKPAAEPAKPAAQPAAAKPAAPAQPKAQAPAAGQTIKWRVAIFGAPRPVTAGLEFFKKEVEAKTNGRVQVELGYGEIFAKSTEIPEAVKAGAVEAGNFVAAYYPGKIPLWTLLELGFFAPEDPEVLGRVQMALFEHPAIKEELKKWNAVALLPEAIPTYNIIGKKRIAKVDDLKGVRMRVAGETAKPLKEFGIVESLIPAPEFYGALDKGVIDAIAIPTSLAAPWKLHEVSKYFTDKISLGTVIAIEVANIDAWNKLPPDVQKVMLEARDKVPKVMADAYAQEEAKAFGTFREKNMEIIAFPAAERAKLLANAEKHWQAWVEDKQKKNLPGQELFSFTQAKMKELSRR